MSNNLITTHELCRVFRTDEMETTALSNLELRIGRGEFISIMGPSGCGKSTLLNIIGMIDSPSSGEYHFMDNEISKLSEKSRAVIRKINIGFVFQNFNLIDELTVYENIELPLRYLKVPQKERQYRIENRLIQMNILHRRNHFPYQLSGGQQQRVALSRAIINEPSLILADEPTGNLDSSNGDDVMNLLSDLHKSGATIVMVTHSQYCANFGDRIIRMKDGKIVSQ